MSHSAIIFKGKQRQDRFCTGIIQEIPYQFGLFIIAKCYTLYGQDIV